MIKRIFVGILILSFLAEQWVVLNGIAQERVRLSVPVLALLPEVSSVMHLAAQ
jgi:hypothetical protein